MNCLIWGGPPSLEKVGDDNIYECCRYRLGGTVARLLESGARKQPKPEYFRALVEQEHGESTRWPAITTDALGW